MSSFKSIYNCILLLRSLLTLVGYKSESGYGLTFICQLLEKSKKSLTKVVILKNRFCIKDWKKNSDQSNDWNIFIETVLVWYEVFLRRYNGNLLRYKFIVTMVLTDKYFPRKDVWKGNVF